MSTVRRIYFYTLSLISALVVIWGVINLLRTIVEQGLVGSGTLLATGLSLVLVGTPIFYVHWRAIQQEALREPEERASRIRAIFLYGVLVAVMVPILYALIALLSRGLTLALGQEAQRAWFGSQQSTWDNLIALVANSVALVYFWRILHADWLANPPENFLPDTRRLYRYFWVAVGLILTISGAYNLLRYLFQLPGQSAAQSVPMLSGGITLLLMGAPLLVYFWWEVQTSLLDPVERRSLLRLVVLYIISLAGVVGVLASGGSVLNALIRWILGEQRSFFDFLRANSAELGLLIPLGVMWAYYGNLLNREVASMPDQPRRAALRRLYNYILSFLGLCVSFAGILNLINFLVQMVFSGTGALGSFRGMISSAVSALLIGLPLWLLPWRLMQREAARGDNSGDHARRSVLRRAYLYLALFLLVIGGMFFTGYIFYELLNALFSQVSAGLGIDLVRLLLLLGAVIALLVYHWRALRADTRLAQQTLGSLHADFPTLILVDQETGFADAVLQALNQSAPRLPVALHPIERGAPDESMLRAKAILLPASVAIRPPDSLRLWLEEYRGRRIVVPLPFEDWFWLGHSEKAAVDLAREAARAVRQMAEGESVRQALPNSPWAIAGYILGGLFGLQLLIVLFSLLFSALFR